MGYIGGEKGGGGGPRPDSQPGPVPARSSPLPVRRRRRRRFRRRHAAAPVAPHRQGLRRFSSPQLLWAYSPPRIAPSSHHHRKMLSSPPERLSKVVTHVHMIYSSMQFRGVIQEV
ncbi:uncharacterized protein [Physcomitrium patens]|uniref:uncharacterized protein n=1 Tax=Physcomitrium patens TaxID=3218 RepID=UPI003CCCE707